MWHKTFAGLFSGLIFFLFLPTAISLLFPMITAVMLTLTVIIFIPAWAGIMTYCYAAPSVKHAWLRALIFTLSSVFTYLSAYFIVGFTFGTSI